MKCFEMYLLKTNQVKYNLLTVNMKCFEIIEQEAKLYNTLINRKHEMF